MESQDCLVLMMKHRKQYRRCNMDILEKIELFLGEEISGTPSVGTTTGDVAKVQRRSDIINKKKKKKDGDDEDDSEQEIQRRDRKTRVKSGSQAISGIRSLTV